MLTRRAAAILVVFAAGCTMSGSHTANSTIPTQPSPNAYDLSGSVTATNGGQAAGGVTVQIGSMTTATDAAGHFDLTAPPSSTVTQALTLSGANDLTRGLFIQPSTHTLALDLIVQDGTFDLAFYRELVRDNYDSPGLLRPLIRWLTAPKFFVKTVDEAGVAIDQPSLNAAGAAIVDGVSQWTHGQFSATVSFGPTPPTADPSVVTVVWENPVDGNTCGKAVVGGTEVWFNYLNTQCACGTKISPTMVRHEVGHILGFWHTDQTTDLMYPQIDECNGEPSPRERYHAAIAYQRPVGNTDPDNDPSTTVESLRPRIIEP